MNNTPDKVIYSMIQVSKYYDKKAVLKDISLSYFHGAKIGVLGLNGAGKSSLLRILAGEDKEFNGETILSNGFTVGYLEQEPLVDIDKTVREVVEEGVQGTIDLLREFVEINNSFAEPMDDAAMDKLIERQGQVQENLDAVILRARKRETLWQGMGETLQATPSPGVRALFVGESGTGKTLAASYISTALTAPLYRVDLSAVMNKYIGESEKNLSMLLDQAAATDVVLLFDEADALFGSRTDGKETGERYANMLTNFLLTRIETHPGIVILTTNSSERIDNAFNRRIDAVIEFPLPGYEQRLQLWRSHLGKRGPGEPVYRNLASYCDLAGGQIRNVVLTAAVYAENTRISTADLWQGLRAEYNKLGRELPHKLNFLNVSSHAA